jgi:hypothetical protein
LEDVFSSSAIASENLTVHTWGAGQAITRNALLNSWFAGESLSPFMAGLAADAAAAQGESDLRLARAMAAKLAGKQKNDRRVVTLTMQKEAAAAAALAITQWRNGVLKSQAVAGDKTYNPASIVAWRACAAAMADTGMADTLELSAVSDAFLFERPKDMEGYALAAAWAVEPLAVACLGGFETRNDKASRLLLERAKARRKAALPARMEGYKGASRCKAATVERVEGVARLLIEGSDIESASLAVGFNVQKGRMSAASQLAKSVRRLRLPFSLHPAKASKDEAAPRYRQTFPIVDYCAGEQWARGLRADVLANGCIDWAASDAVAFVPSYSQASLSTVSWLFLYPVKLGSVCGARCLAAARVRHATKGRFNRYARQWGITAVSAVAHFAGLPPRMRQKLIRSAIANFQPFKGYCKPVGQS